VIGFRFVSNLAHALHHARFTSITRLRVLVFHFLAERLYATLFIGMVGVIGCLGVIRKRCRKQVLVAKTLGTKEIGPACY
jgi:hypothetical protein